ncbi:MAG TPA: DUF2798 domain-containing protein [Holophaga sp.]|nr:DUF2798 domain-containing protein [Holophaga sp.]
MPRTSSQKILFGVLMALAMVYGMEVYNASIRSGALLNASFQVPPLEILLLCGVVILLETFVGGPLARRLAFKVVDPGRDRPVFVIVAVSVFTVCCMCPMMSLVAVAWFKGIDGAVLPKWLQTTALNLPMAMGWQLLVAGPLVRLVFRRLCSARREVRAAS